MTVFSCPRMSDISQNQNKYVRTLELCQHENYERVLIFLHGVGGCGEEWARFWKKIIPSNTKLVLPTAPSSPVTLYFGKEMNSW